MEDTRIPVRHVATIEVSFFAFDVEDATQIASELQREIFVRVLGAGQSNVVVKSVRAEITHDRCAELGICMCGREVK